MDKQERIIQVYCTYRYLELPFPLTSAVLFRIAVNHHLQIYVKDKRQMIVIKNMFFVSRICNVLEKCVSPGSLADVFKHNRNSLFGDWMSLM